MKRVFQKVCTSLHSSPNSFFKALLDIRQYFLVAGWVLYSKRWVYQGRKLLSALSLEPRRHRLHGPGGWAACYSEGCGLRAHELPLCPAPPPYTSYASVVSYFHAVTYEAQGSVAVTCSSLKGPVPCYFSVHLHLPLPGLGKPLPAVPPGQLWS